MSDKGGDGDLGEAEVVGNAGEAVPQDVRCDVPERRFREELLPALREISDRVVLALAGEDERPVPLQARGFEIVDDWKTYWSYGGTFLAVP